MNKPELEKENKKLKEETVNLRKQIYNDSEAQIKDRLMAFKPICDFESASGKCLGPTAIIIAIDDKPRYDKFHFRCKDHIYEFRNLPYNIGLWEIKRILKISDVIK